MERILPGEFKDEPINLDNKVVHWLSGGKTLCRMPGFPRDWPPNHYFVSRNRADEKFVSCPVCKQVLEEARVPEQKRNEELQREKDTLLDMKKAKQL